MTATTPQPMEGTQAPNQIEYLYERYRPALKWLLVVVVGVFAAYYFFKYQQQKAVDEYWTQFNVTIGTEGIYTQEHAGLPPALTDLLADQDLAELESRLAAADAQQKPFLLITVARKAMLDGNWDRAESALTELETQYPKHSLVTATSHPIQIREQKEVEDPTPAQRRKPEYEEPVAGSIVARMREQIAAARDYSTPEHFQKPEIPADATKVVIEFEGYGNVTIALMPQAPKHEEKFLALVDENFWDGQNVDEIQRDGESAWSKRPMQLHFGFASTKEADRTKWVKTDASEHQIAFEETGLSHFPGAVSARAGEDGKSAVDRIYISVEDNPDQDDRRVVFGYVVEGLDVVEEICRASMTAQEETSGMGAPTENITIKSVTKQ